MAYGDGSLFLRDGVWYALLYVRGRRVRESLQTGDEEVAKKRLVALRRRRERGEYQVPSERRITVGELLDDLLVELEVKGRTSLRTTRCHVKAVREELGHVRAGELETARIERVAKDWLLEGKARATVNRRLEWLGRAFRIALRRSPPKVRAVPYIPLLHVDNVRTGFFEPAELERLLPHLEADLADFAAWCYTTGMRKGEAAALTWSMLDRTGDVWALKIPAPIAKNRERRSLPVVGSARAVIERRLKARRLDTPLIFHRASKGKPGRPIKAFDKAWANALKEARLPKGRLFHDLRRSAARNLRRSGATETEAMRVTGHKTASMFRRYSIVTDDDVAAALRKQDVFLGRWKPRRG